MRFIKLLAILGFIDRRNYIEEFNVIKRAERKAQFYKNRMMYLQKAHSLEELKPLLD